MYTDHERKKMETQNKLSEAASEGTSSLRTWFNGVNLLVGIHLFTILLFSIIPTKQTEILSIL